MSGVPSEILNPLRPGWIKPPTIGPRTAWWACLENFEVFADGCDEAVLALRMRARSTRNLQQSFTGILEGA